MLPASYGGAEFKVEVDTQGGGRRNVTHEFPKYDTPWTEDMGRKARSWRITGYCIGPFYLDDRDALIAVLDAEGPFTLVHPTLGEVQANAGEYFVTEVREKGGFAAFEMPFFEAGQQPDTAPTDDTQAQVSSQAASTNSTITSTGNNALAGQGGIGSDAVAGSQVSPSITAPGASDIPQTG